MATRGHLGGLAVAAPQTIRVLDAAGFDTVLVETVGVGQSEVDVAGQVDVTLVLLAPGMGDGIQAAKAGVLEIGDLFVVNKADRDGAHAVVRELRNMVGARPADTGGLEAAGADHERAWTARASPSCWPRSTASASTPSPRALLGRRRRDRARREIESLVLARVRATLPTHGRGGLDGLATEVAAGRLDAYTATDRVLGHP